jgi:hypothetical protein
MRHFVEKMLYKQGGKGRFVGMETKICTKCKVEKAITEYQKNPSKKEGIRSQCKECVSVRRKLYYQNKKESIIEITRQYYEANKIKCLNRNKEWREKNRETILQKKKEWREKNSEKIKLSRKIWYLNNKDHHKEKRKKYRKENLEKIKEYQKEYQKEYRKKYYEDNKEYFIKKQRDYIAKNKDMINEKRRAYQKQKRKTDPIYNLARIVRGRIGMALKNSNIYKNQRTNEYLGISFPKYKLYLESKFLKGMSWDNQGEWHIDHIIPLGTATNEEELKALFHYSNTQPMWATENLKKGAKIPSGVQISIPL